VVVVLTDYIREASGPLVEFLAERQQNKTTRNKQPAPELKTEKKPRKRIPACKILFRDWRKISGCPHLENRHNQLQWMP